MVTTTLEKTIGGEIKATGISKVFQDASGGEIVALELVNLNIQPGEFLSIVGTSGCGKSTLLRMMAGLDSPTSGELFLDGELITTPNYERGLVFQDPTLFPWLNVEQNIASGLVARKLYQERKHEIEDYIGLVGLNGFEKLYPHQLSGGMAQRVALARALVNHPKVLLLDEPLGALDAFTRMQMQDELLGLWQERGTTMILVTHDVDEAIYLSDRIIIMTPRPGRIEEIIEVPLGHPRNRSHPEFMHLRIQILETMHLIQETSLSYYL